jgi:dienelactone hydrolase
LWVSQIKGEKARYHTEDNKSDTTTLQIPIYECARCIRVDNVVHGARIDIYQNELWIGGADASTTSVDVEVFPSLRPGATVTAVQTLCDHSNKSSSATVIDRTQELPIPTMVKPYVGDHSIIVDGLIPGATIEVEEVSEYKLIIGRAHTASTMKRIFLSLPLFTGAKLRARQSLCATGNYSPTINVSEPPEWPLGEGPFKAGFKLVSDIPISSKVGFLTGPGGFDRPLKNKAVIFYPATEAGENVSVATGFFPLIVFGHAKRFLATSTPVCRGTPTDITQDFRQLSGIFAHMARWGFIIISPDLSWMTYDAMDFNDKPIVLNDAISYMIAENSRVGSPFNGRILTGGYGAMGHSAGGLTTIYGATSVPRTHLIDAMALIAPAAKSASDISSRIESFAPNPVLIIHGTNDTGKEGADEEPLNIYKAAKAKKYLIKIDGANHFGYTDSLCLQPPGDAAATIKQADQQRITKGYLTAFFLRYLKGASGLDNYLAGIRPIEGLSDFVIRIDAEL